MGWQETPNQSEAEEREKSNRLHALQEKCAENIYSFWQALSVLCQGYPPSDKSERPVLICLRSTEGSPPKKITCKLHAAHLFPVLVDDRFITDLLDPAQETDDAFSRSEETFMELIKRLYES
jgi:hypothetical protein